MALSRQTRRYFASPVGRLLLLAVGLVAVNLVTLVVLHLLPMPDSSTLPGRLPEHDISLDRP
ncbi:MAG: hypothetical protein ACI8RZ_005087 [Myxococcota bacterium]|jgi:hypothetical protein